MRLWGSVIATVCAVCVVGVSVASGAVITGTARPDVLRGTASADTIRGGAGADTIYGRGGPDRIFGGPGNDRIYGGPGNDVLDGGPGADRIYGGPGNDLIRARDGVRDIVVCGPGFDTAVVDARDVTIGCERVNRPVVLPRTTPGGTPVVGAPTPAPPASPAPPPAPGAARETAVPIGTALDVNGSWRVNVVSVTPNATAAVLAENQFNDPPGPGGQFFIARVSATYLGGGSARFDGSFRLRAVGPSAVSYSTFSNSCGVIPDDLADPDVFTGGTITGNVCWAVSSVDAGGLVMFDDPLLPFNSTRYYFRLY